MACSPPYKVGTASNTSPVGSIEAIFPCCAKSPCANGISRKPTGCMSPCGDYYQTGGKDDWQCYSSGYIDKSIVTYPRCGGYLTWISSYYSAQYDYGDLCCVTLDPQYKGKYVAANSGTYRIKMAKWPRYYISPSGFPTYLDNLTETPPPMEEIGYLRTEPKAPWKNYYCGITINPNISLGCNTFWREADILTKSPIQIVAVTIVFGDDCSIKYYYGYHEIPLNAGDAFKTVYTILPLEIPSFVWYAGGYGAYDTPAVSLPFMSVMTPENDAGAWLILNYQNTGGCRAYSSTDTETLQKACSNSRPMTPAFRRRMIQNKISSRIKKIHYKT